MSKTPFDRLIGRYIRVRGKLVRINTIEEWHTNVFDTDGKLLNGIVIVNTWRGKYKLAPNGRVDEVLNQGEEVYRVGSHKFDLTTVS